MKRTGIGILGAGAISGIYLENLSRLFTEVEIIGVYDLMEEKVRAAQEAYGFRKAYHSMEELLSDSEVEIVLNLTRPFEHYETTRAALLSGKHVYSEKPLAAVFEEGQELAALAEEKGLMLGGAPDTFLGAGIQTCRKLIDDGFIGIPVGAAAFMMCRGHESWHPSPEFYYQHGGGPMMDMGPYYITALINLLGGVSGLTGVAAKSFPTRIVTSGPKKGTVIDVEVPTHIAGIMNFDCGAVGTILTTFDVHSEQQARLEIYGSRGTLYVPDPNGFGGPVWLLRPESGNRLEIPLLFDYSENSRGLGIADMAKALQTGRPFRADVSQTLHVLEIMTAFEKSSREGKYQILRTSWQKKDAMKLNPVRGILD